MESSKGAWSEASWERGQHVGGTACKWTSLFLDSVLPLENVWLPWRLPSQWRSWSPPLTATIHSQSSTPKRPERELVSIFPPRSSTHVPRGEQPGRATTQAGSSSPAAPPACTAGEGPGAQSPTGPQRALLLEERARAGPPPLLGSGFLLYRMRRLCS